MPTSPLYLYLSYNCVVKFYVLEMQTIAKSPINSVARAEKANVNLLRTDLQRSWLSEVNSQHIMQDTAGVTTLREHLPLV